MIDWERINNEVYYASDTFASLTKADINELKKKAMGNGSRKCRLCLHADEKAPVHEMFIAFGNGAYIRPHKHLKKEESFHLIEGTADAIFFDDKGNITEVLRMGDFTSGRYFYYRLSQPRYHTLIVRSDFIVFKEVTKGPLVSGETDFAEWSPEENSSEAKNYMKKIAKAADELISKPTRHGKNT